MDLSIARELCKKFEGLHAIGKDGLIYPYICPAGYPTQGYGTVYKPDGTQVKLSDPPITKETAEMWLDYELNNVCAPGVIRLCPKFFAYTISSGNWAPFNAIVDFVFNLGVGRLQTSTLRKKLEELDWAEAKTQLRRWVYGGGRILPGLVKRREAECALLP